MTMHWIVLTEDRVSKTYTLVDIFDTAQEALEFQDRDPHKYVVTKISADDLFDQKVNEHPLIIPKDFREKSGKKIVWVI